MLNMLFTYNDTPLSTMSWDVNFLKAKEKVKVGKIYIRIADIIAEFLLEVLGEKYDFLDVVAWVSAEWHRIHTNIVKRRDFVVGQYQPFMEK